MRPFVNLEILATCEHFSTAWKQTRKRFLSSVDADVVDKFVLGLERTQSSATVLPETLVDGLVWCADVFQADVSDEVVHRVESPSTA